MIGGTNGTNHFVGVYLDMLGRDLIMVIYYPCQPVYEGIIRISLDKQEI